MLEPFIIFETMRGSSFFALFKLLDLLRLLLLTDFELMRFAIEKLLYERVWVYERSSTLVFHTNITLWEVCGLEIGYIARNWLNIA